jgi:hypothetical protein
MLFGQIRRHLGTVFHELARRKEPVLDGVASLTILVDNDESGTGQGAALQCSARWTGIGREVFRLVPRRPGADANDLLAGWRR